MRTKFSRQIWAFDPHYIRVEALDDAGQPLGYVYFVQRSIFSGGLRTYRQQAEQPALLRMVAWLGLPLFWVTA
jgi:hypothetical protein